MSRVLIIQYSSNQDGSAFSGLLIANGFREAGWETHVTFGFEGPMVPVYEEAGHQVHVTPHKNWLRRGWTPQFVKDVAQEWRRASAFEALISNLHPSVVYLNTVVSLAGAVAARRSGVPCIWHVREMFDDIGGEMHAPGWAIPFVRRTILWHADEIIANSAATAQNLLGPKAHRATVVPNAVRSAFFDENRLQAEAREAVDLNMGGIIVGVPGTLRPMKGHLFFFESIALILRRHSSIQIAVTGEGAEDVAKEIKKRVRELGIEHCVHFLGWVNDMPAFYRACDLVCIPSRAEPFGRTAIEAFAIGTPVIATAVGGLQDIVSDGETGWLVAYGDHDALRRAVQNALDRPDLRQKMIANARQVAEKKYHERVYKERIASLIIEVATDGHHLQ
jgi:glycosyltransferase involved in cell wall biosynthesis